MVLADSQTEGYGRNSKKWISPDNGNLYLSFFEKIDASNPLNFIPQRCAAASFLTAQHFVSAEFLKIKWPNDILIDMKKASGVIAKTIKIGKNAFFICGVGINLFLPPGESTKFIWPPASLSEKFPKVDPRDVLKELVIQIDDAFALDETSLMQFYAEKIAWMVGKEILFSQDLIKKEKAIVQGFGKNCSTIILKMENETRETAALSILSLK